MRRCSQEPDDSVQKRQAQEQIVFSWNSSAESQTKYTPLLNVIHYLLNFFQQISHTAQALNWVHVNKNVPAAPRCERMRGLLI